MLGRHGHLLAFAGALFISTIGCAAPTVEEDTASSESTLTQISYDGVINLTGTALKTGLFDLVNNHTRLGYDRARENLFNNPKFLSADRKIECNYTGRIVSPNGSNTPGGFNTEHTWPQSMGADREPARSDLHHLFPVDARANSTRGNWPFGTATCAHPTTTTPTTPTTPTTIVNDENGGEGEVVDGEEERAASATTCSFSEGGSFYGKDSSGKSVFEVRKEKRGDVARAKFYFSVRYKLAIPATEETTLRAWHAEDPVAPSEVTRNDAVESLQKNRNPFVDHPEFVERITDF